MLSLNTKLNRKSSPGNITHTREFQTLYFLVGVANEARKEKYRKILHFTFLFSLFVFVTAAGHYFRIWTDQVPALF